MMHRWLLLAALLIGASVPARAQEPAQAPWAVDSRVSTLGFSVTQIGSIVAGKFPIWSGIIVLDPAAPAGARIDIRIDTRAVTAGNRDVDSLLKGPGFLDVEKFPEARFVSTSVVATGDGRYEARGKLTIRDVTRDLTLPFTLAVADAPGTPAMRQATARGRIVLKRLDFGVGRNEWANTGQVANEVTVDLDVRASRPR